MLNLTDHNAQDLVTKNVVIDFWAPWCGPCRQLAPTFEAAEARFPRITFYKCNIDEQPRIASRFGVRSIPTIVLMRGGVVISTVVGPNPAQLDALLRAVKP